MAYNENGERGLKISLVATVRNEQATIRSFVESLLAQSVHADEIIIVDGASTDGTREILEEFSAAGTIHVISQACNIAQGRNLGIRYARNDLIAITDAGCRVDTAWIANILKCFASPAAPDVVAGNFRFDCHSPFEEAITLATFSPTREKTETAQYFPSSRSVAFRKSAWQKAKGYPEWLYAAEDTLLSIRLRQLGYKFLFCKDAIVYWRPRESWSQLAKQRFNFSRGNARVGIATSGYLTNVQFHGTAFILLIASLLWWPMSIAALVVLLEHVRRHLWHQAKQAQETSDDTAMFFRVLAVMEFIRIVNIAGFVAGRLDRWMNPNFRKKQKEWMGVDSVEKVIESPQAGSQSAVFWRKVATHCDRLANWIAIPSVAAGVVLIAGSGNMGNSLAAVFCVALVFSTSLLVKSIYDFSQTGPPLKEEITRHYRAYSLFALARLGAWAFLLCVIMALSGVLLYVATTIVAGAQLRFAEAIGAAVAGVLVVSTLQFCQHLLFLPGSIAASYHYRISRLYPLWRQLTPKRLVIVRWTLGTAAMALFGISAWKLFSLGDGVPGFGFALLVLAGALIALAHSSRHSSWAQFSKTQTSPNIVMIGSDTLRADRLGAAEYRRDLTPFIDSLARKGTQFTSCYVPCARTAPSLLSMLTGTWPQRHGIRDNFVGDEETALSVRALPSILSAHGYRTAAVSDWSGGDFGKFALGFEMLDLPKDQWNIKYLIRQGPKDLRLFLSLFTHNRFGKRFLPELYYLAGVPLTDLVGRDARELISRFASQSAPFFLNVFVSTTHPPFGSEYPYYTLWSDKDYAGESKFVMARLTDPWDIIRRQGDTRKDFDLEQVIDLYDGCVRNFDDEVKRIVEHVKACGLEDNTIIVIYSDHGMEFFEHDSWGQGNSVRGDFSARIPLVILDPRLEGRGPCSHVVRSIDVTPTLLELVGIASTAGADGVSLVPYLKRDAPDMNLAAFNETGIWLTELPGMLANHLRYPNLLDLLEVPDRRTGTLAIKPKYREAIITAKDRMVRIGSWKLIYQPTSNGVLYALFDLSIDPECRHDVAAEHPEIFRELRDLLMHWMGWGRTAASMPEDKAAAPVG